MQQQLEKVTDLIRLMLQKLEIQAEVENDDSPKGDRNDKFVKMQKIRQTISAARRFNQWRSLSYHRSSQCAEHSEA